MKKFLLAALIVGVVLVPLTASALHNGSVRRDMIYECDLCKARVATIFIDYNTVQDAHDNRGCPRTSNGAHILGTLLFDITYRYNGSAWSEVKRRDVQAELRRDAEKARRVREQRAKEPERRQQLRSQAEPYVQAAIDKFNGRDYEGAKQLFSQAVEIDPYNTQTHYGLALASYNCRKPDYDLIVSELNQAKKLATTNDELADCHELMAAVLEQLSTNSNINQVDRRNFAEYAKIARKSAAQLRRKK